MADKIQISLEVEDKGSLVVRQFSGNAQKELGKVDGATGSLASRAQSHLASMSRGVVDVTTKMAKWAAVATAAGVALAGWGVKKFANSIIDAASTAEDYRLRLNALLGDVREGSRLFKDMADYASKVPFQYREIMGAATALSGVMSGGVDEIKRWMPLIGDLAAASGLGFEETTSQVIRMYSAGAASADLFRERGILAMLGFQAGVSYSVEDTRRMMFEAWDSSGSKFKGLTEELGGTWKGIMSMFGDAWFAFRNMIADAGLWKYMKAGVQSLLDKINALKENGTLAEWAKKISDAIISTLESVKAFAVQIYELSESGALTNWAQLIYTGIKDAAKSLGDFAMMIVGIVVPAVKEGILWMQWYWESIKEFFTLPEVTAVINFFIRLKEVIKNNADQIVAAAKEYAYFYAGLKIVSGMTATVTFLSTLAAAMRTAATATAALNTAMKANVAFLAAYAGYKAGSWLYDKFGAGGASDMARLQSEFDQIKAKNAELDRLLEQRKTLEVDFLGRGSTEAPLSEKIDEMAGKISGFGQRIGQINPVFMADMQGYTGDTTGPLSSVMDSVATDFEDLTSRINNMSPTYSVGVSSISGSGLFAGDSDLLHDQFGQVDLYEQRKRDAAGYTPPVASFASGTGLAGLPYTGLFMGHKGEIVKNPSESNAERSGGGNVYLTVSMPMMLPPTDSQMDEIARQLHGKLKALRQRYGE